MKKEEKKDAVKRIGADFQKELDDIKKENKKKFKSKRKPSNGKITNKISKHNYWQQIKEDLINFNFNKKGLATIGVFTFIFMVFIWILFLGILVFIFNQTATSLDIDVDLGQVNLGEIVQDTFGKLNEGLLSGADTIGLVIIFGMIITMFANAYIFRGEYPRLFLIIDIILLVFAYILSVYISNTYEILINASSTLNVFIDTLPKASTFILRLPTYVGVIGAIIMILSYSGFPRETEEEIIVGQIR